jgi:hypothetical protein
LEDLSIENKDECVDECVGECTEGECVRGALYRGRSRGWTNSHSVL